MSDAVVGSIVFAIGLAFLALLVLVLVIWFGAFYTVEQQTAAVVERFGKFLRISEPGLHVRIPFVDQIRSRVSLRVQQASIHVDSKSKDNVFVDLSIAVQYQVKHDTVRDAVYQLTNPEAQLEAYVLDAVRARVPSMDLIQVFEDKESIAAAVDTELSQRMEQYGFTIVSVLVNDIVPDAAVRNAMNQVQASTREREAAYQRAEASRITIVKQAEAEAEGKRLQGEGLANQRKAIAQGLRESVELVRLSGDVIDDKAVMDLLLLVQWMDTQKEIAGNNRATVIFLPNNPGAMFDIADQIRTSMLAAQAANLDGSSGPLPRAHAANLGNSQGDGASEPPPTTH